jgi:hypothetical protein
MKREHDLIYSSETETNQEMSFRERSSSDSNRQDSPNTTLDSHHIESAVPPPTPQSSDDTLRSINAYGYEPISPQEQAYHRASALMALEAPPPQARSPTPPHRSVPSAPIWTFHSSRRRLDSCSWRLSSSPYQLYPSTWRLAQSHGTSSLKQIMRSTSGL